ncbi:MAG: serine/threonine-protein kinase [Leptolyngbyaceae cyanobacterium bins.302]|nr:serine/threonine-protein kinase [Leptolyngbyaceae cyanobacterium bins.302]
MSSLPDRVVNSFAKELHRSKYRLLGLVGQGQFGRVYCASHRKTGRLVALKELDRDRFSTHKFLRELRFLLSLQHENIVTCHAMEQTATGRYLVMDYCEGGTLRSLLDEEVRLHPIQGLNLITQILAGLAHAHQRGIVHCDIKPENILLTITAQGWIAKISDFGIARVSQELATDEFSNTGSPAYMAPERFYGQYSQASDLYAVGVLLFEMLTGYRPFSGAPDELMSAHLNQSVQVPPSVPDELKAVICKSLQKLPARRFRSAQQMLEALQAAIATAELALSQGWSSSTLLSSYSAATPTRFICEYQELLDTPIQQIISSYCRFNSPQTIPNSQFQANQFFRVYGNRVGCQAYSKQPLDAETSAPRLLRQPPPSMTRVRLANPILNLVVQSDGCFAATQQGVYWLKAALFNLVPESASHVAESATALAIPQLVAEFDRHKLVAIAPNGRWMATLNQSTEQSSQLHIWNLQNCQPFQPSVTVSTAPGFQLLALDSRHLAVFSHATDRSAQASIIGVHIDCFSRRGTEAGCLRLPVPLRRLTPSPTPYRFLATEPNHPNSLLFLDIKPLRIQRIGLDLVPDLIAATAWGYAVASQSGQIVLLNQYGEWIGHIDGPRSPTAIAFLAPHQLLIATWEDTHGYLFGVNLRDLDLDMLF